MPMPPEAKEHRFELANSRLALLWLAAAQVLLLLLTLLTPWPQAGLFLLLMLYPWLRHRQLRVRGIVQCNAQYWLLANSAPRSLKRIDSQPWGLRLHFKGVWPFNQRFIWRDQLNKQDWSQLCSLAKTKAW